MLLSRFIQKFSYNKNFYLEIWCKSRPWINNFITVEGTFTFCNWYAIQTITQSLIKFVMDIAIVFNPGIQFPKEMQKIVVKGQEANKNEQSLQEWYGNVSLNF